PTVLAVPAVIVKAVGTLVMANGREVEEPLYVASPLYDADRVYPPTTSCSGKAAVARPVPSAMAVIDAPPSAKVTALAAGAPLRLAPTVTVVPETPLAGRGSSVMEVKF